LDEDSVDADVERSKLLALYFKDKHWPGKGILWEFIDINIRKVTTDLRKHLDYKNDQRKGYNDAAIYSEIIHCGDNAYKMTYVFTSRASCGSLNDRVLKQASVVSPPEDIASESTFDSTSHQVKKQRRHADVFPSSANPKSVTSWYEQAQSNKNMTEKVLESMAAAAVSHS
jgi:hypothetical protein